MRPTPSEELEDPDLVQTLPVTALTGADLATPTPSPDAWDEEAPTAVNSRSPLFAGPPRVPTT